MKFVHNKQLRQDLPAWLHQCSALLIKQWLVTVTTTAMPRSIHLKNSSHCHFQISRSIRSTNVTVPGCQHQVNLLGAAPVSEVTHHGSWHDHGIMLNKCFQGTSILTINKGYTAYQWPKELGIMITVSSVSCGPPTQGGTSLVTAAAALCAQHACSAHTQSLHQELQEAHITNTMQQSPCDQAGHGITHGS
jgi:hypothetical protein